jgi:penicillin-binding protein 2
MIYQQEKRNIPDSKTYKRMYPTEAGDYNHIQLYWTGWSPDDSIQLASMMATVANEGYYYTPHIIKKN